MSSAEMKQCMYPPTAAADRAAMSCISVSAVVLEILGRQTAEMLLEACREV